jgi:hypothetical protein
MSWFRENRLLGAFIVGFGVALIASLAFLWFAKSSFDEAKARFDESASALNTLQRQTPFPNEGNLRAMKAHAEEYAAQLNKAKEEMRTHALPVTPLAPNEFQARLRQAVMSVAQKAHENHVKLPDNFNLGFDEFVAALPDTAAAPLLGQQLAQVEMVVNMLIDARIDALTSLRRVAADTHTSATAKPTPSATPAAASGKGSEPSAASLVERTAIDASFVSSPAAARRALNQITTINQQFYIIRTLHVLNEKDKGPPRDAAATASVSAASTGTGPPTNTALTFIVGNEHIQTAARIEMLRFTF